MAKKWAKAFYNSALWEKERAYILKRDRYTCTEPGCFRLATEVHHIKEITQQNINDVNITLNEHNLRALCSDCHKRITKAEHGREGKENLKRELSFDDEGNPIETPPPNNRSSTSRKDRPHLAMKPTGRTREGCGKGEISINGGN